MKDVEFNFDVLLLFSSLLSAAYLRHEPQFLTVSASVFTSLYSSFASSISWLLIKMLCNELLSLLKLTSKHCFHPHLSSSSVGFYYSLKCDANFI